MWVRCQTFRASFQVVVIVFLLLSSPAESKDPYRALGLARDASDAAIKAAYRKLALKHHPDKNPKGQTRFIEVQQAYQTLTDPDKRRMYDQTGSYGDEHEQRYQQYRQQHQQHYYSYNQRPNYEHLLPSETTTLTNSNFRAYVHYGRLPWLIQIYSEDSMACREASSIWEAAWRSMGQSSNGLAVAGLGRVHWRHQRQLAEWIAKGPVLLGSGLEHASLPLVFGVRTDCKESRCIKRFTGNLTLAHLQEFVADSLLDLPRIPSLQLGSFDVFMQRASIFKVLGFAFAQKPGPGSLYLRRLAYNQQHMMQFVRVVYQDAEAEEWKQRLRLPAAATLTSSSLVLDRGPGSTAEVLSVKKSGADLQQMVTDSGFSWQYVPAVRQHTAGPMGCLWGREAARSRSGLAELCVVAVGPAGAALARARLNLVYLVHRFTNPAAAVSPTLGPSAKAFMDARWRMGWLETSSQAAVCTFHFPPTSSDGNGGASARRLHEAVCGTPLASRMWQTLTRQKQTPSAVHLLAFKPAAPGQSWIGNRRVVSHYQHATFTSIDLASPDLTYDQYTEMAEWVSDAFREPDQTLKSSPYFPPPLASDDEEESGVHFVLSRIMAGFSALVKLLGTAVFGAQALGGNGSGSLQEYTAIVLAFVAVYVAHWCWAKLNQHAPLPNHMQQLQQQQQQHQQQTIGNGSAPAAHLSSRHRILSQRSDPDDSAYEKEERRQRANREAAAAAAVSEVRETAHDLAASGSHAHALAVAAMVVAALEADTAVPVSEHPTPSPTSMPSSPSAVVATPNGVPPPPQPSHVFSFPTTVVALPDISGRASAPQTSDQSNADVADVSGS